MISYVVEDKHVEVFMFLADAIVHETTPENIEPFLDENFDKSKLEEYCQSFTKPSEVPGFRDCVKECVNCTPVSSSRTFVLLMNVLDSRVLAPILTGSITLIRDMGYKEREELLRSWQNSNLESFRRLFKLLYSLSITTFIKLCPDLHNQVIGYPGKEMRDEIYENIEIDPFRYLMLEHPTGDELYAPNIDVLIIGSGSGAGVVAHTLSNDGHKCLVLEKGKYFHPTELVFDEKDGNKNLYESRGVLTTVNQQTMILAGSTFGGGSTVNWSACLKTPFKVRKEWYDDYGVDWAANELYDKCADYVWNKMGATLDSVKHSFSNQVILNGAEKLGYTAKPVEQNNGNHPNHSCGFCHLGCKFNVKQGSSACWFRDASEKGCQFMDQVKVVKVLHSGGKAVGALCQDTQTGHEFTIKGPKKFVVCGGSLNTPVVLQNSGFKNKNIGANLKLHPVTVIFGDFGKDNNTKPFNESILTTVCTEVDDLDGKAHGAKIETVLHTPLLESVFMPWQSSDKARQDLLRYNHLAAMLIITRDKSSGTIRADATKPDSLIIDYSINKYDRNALLQAILVSADMLYVEGAKEIIHPQRWVPNFQSNKPKEERSVKDRDYVQWRESVSKTKLDTFGCPYGSAHQMSSCRISGKGPKYGACDNKGRLYECKNVYVADASAMPTASGANPMISTMSIARLIALGISKDLQPQARL